VIDLGPAEDCSLAPARAVCVRDVAAMNPFLEDSSSLDVRMREAVAAIDAGDVAMLDRLIAAHPDLVQQRLASPGAWLRDVAGSALNGFFRQPYLLWFVAEDPVRNGRLPANIADVCRTIVDAARRNSASNVQEQLDHALTLASYSWIARDAGVQLALLDVLIDSGAALGRTANCALVNGNVAAAEHLVKRGAELTLAVALCLGRWGDVERLIARASDGEKQFALVMSALRGNADAVSRLLRAGADRDAPSAELYPHATPLHHAVSSGSLATVRVLVDAGADVTAVDTAWHATPLGWARHALENASAADGKEYGAIARLLSGGTAVERQGSDRSPAELDSDAANDR